jgi:hypothetical protein
LNVTGTSNLSTINVTTLNAASIFGSNLNVTGTSNLSTTNITTLNSASIFGTNVNVSGTSNLVTIFAPNSLTATNVFVSNGLDVGPGTLGTNVVIFSNVSGGANVFVMDANGRVGIGTTSPTTQLMIQGVGGDFSGISLLRLRSLGSYGTGVNFDGTAQTGGKSVFIWTTTASASEGAGKLLFQEGQNSTSGSVLALDFNKTSVGIGRGLFSPTANLHVAGNIYASNALQTTNVVTSNINVSTTANIANLVVTSNILAGPAGNTYLTGNLVVSGNVFTSLGTPLGEGGSLYYSLASNYTPPVYTGVLYGQALALSLGPFNEQGSSSLVSRSANGNFRFNKPGIYNVRAVFLTTQDNITGIGIGSNVADVTTARTDQTYVYRYTTFVTQNPTEIFDIQFYVGSTTAYYYVDLFAVDAPTLKPTSDPLGGSWLSIGPLQGGGGSGPPVTISTLGAVVTGRTTSYGAGAGDYYIGMSNGQTVNLPIGSSLTAGKQYIIKDESGLAGTFVGYRVTVAASAPNLIDGQDSVILALNYGAINVIWTGSFWSIY